LESCHEERCPSRRDPRRADDSANEARHTLGGIEYVLPADWQPLDQSEHQTQIIVWSPAHENKRGESVAFMRTREMPALVKSDFARVATFLGEAQHDCPML
jgi:hypothetical protein